MSQEKMKEQNLTLREADRNQQTEGQKERQTESPIIVNVNHILVVALFWGLYNFFFALKEQLEIQR